MSSSIGTATGRVPLRPAASWVDSSRRSRRGAGEYAWLCAVPGFSGRDVGLLVYDSGSGSWSLYMDGVGVGLDGGNDEELSASWIDGSGHMYLSVRSSYTVPGLGGDSSDILACAPRIPLRSGAVPPVSSGTAHRTDSTVSGSTACSSLADLSGRLWIFDRSR